LTAGSGVILVSESQYFVHSVEFSDVSGYSYAGSNGLVVALAEPGIPAVPGQAAIIFTGTVFGDVTVTVDLLDTEPAPDLDAWAEVAEVSLYLAGGGFVTTVGEADEDDLLPGLPAGDVRLRVHARGRDAALEGNEGEEHLLQVWPAPPVAQRTLTTRRCGSPRGGEPVHPLDVLVQGAAAWLPLGGRPTVSLPLPRSSSPRRGG
jgi:hypothetical protein